MTFLRPEILRGFDKYKYSSRDTSPVSNYIMHPFWDWLVQFVPIWIAPNLMTFVGFLLTVFNFLLLALLDNNYEASNIDSHNSIPNFVWLLVAICNFLSHQLDGIDGKQARRTGTSSPLGELFDHGCDSWVVTMLPLTIISIFGTDFFGVSRWQMIVAIWIMIFCFIMTHWEKYITGVLYLPWGYDIGQLAATAAFLITYFCSTNSWKCYLPFQLKMSDFWFYGVVSSVIVFSLPMTIYNVVQSYRHKTGRMLTIYEVVRPIVSPVTLMLASILWATYSPTNVFQNHSRLFLFVFGTVASNITVRLIIAQMSQTRADLVNVSAIVYISAVIVVLVFQSIMAKIELSLLWFLCVTFTSLQVFCAYSVVNDMCDHLKIQAFSISHRLKAQK